MSSNLRFVVFSALIITASVALSQQKASQAPCSAPEHHEFDFWVGEWDLTWPGKTQAEVGHGSNSIRRLLDNCVIEENFSGGESMALRGMSVSTFDARAGKWKQTWVDSEGGYLDFVGEFSNAQMVLAREGTRPDGTKIQQRMVWKNISKQELDWSWERSVDGGKTWEVLWPIHYKRKA